MQVFCIKISSQLKQASGLRRLDTPTPSCIPFPPTPTAPSQQLGSHIPHHSFSVCLTAQIPISLPKAATPLVQSKCQNLGAANQFSQQKLPVKLTGSSAELQNARAWGTRRQSSLNKGCRNTGPANYHLTRFTSNSTIRILWEVFKWNFSQGNRNSGHQISHHL